GVLQPMGEYKGSGLALMIGLVAGVLNGAAFGRDVIDFNADDDSATNTGHAIVAVDIARFVPLHAFTAEVDRHIRDLRGSQLLPGFDAIRLPGERRTACRDARSRDGIPVPAPLLAQLDKLAADLSRCAHGDINTARICAHSRVSGNPENFVNTAAAYPGRGAAR